MEFLLKQLKHKNNIYKSITIRGDEWAPTLSIANVVMNAFLTCNLLGGCNFKQPFGCNIAHCFYFFALRKANN